MRFFTTNDWTSIKGSWLSIEFDFCIGGICLLGFSFHPIHEYLRFWLLGFGFYFDWCSEWENG